MKIPLLLFFLLLVMAFSANAQVDSLLIQEGTASFYGKKFHGRRTASGEIFSLDSLTAAHKRLPLGTWVRVTNKKNNLSVVVRVNDRLPSSSKRQIDISRAAALQIDMVSEGIAPVRIEALDLDELDRLIEYYQDKDHSPLRLRPYHRIIEAPDRVLDLRLTIPEIKSPEFFGAEKKLGMEPVKGSRGKSSGKEKSRTFSLPGR